MENGRITDSQITASSSYTANIYYDRPHNARLNGVSAWAAGLGDNDPWIQVDFVQDLWVTGVATQGYGPAWVRVQAYFIEHRINGSSNWTTTEVGLWFTSGCCIIFPGGPETIA